jgi:predicted nucleic acid-binding protein
MNILVDTKILTRSAEPGHAMHATATSAVTSLRGQGHTLCVIPQVLYEFWVVCTRPTSVNGLGKTAAEAATELAALRALFPMLDDTPAIFPAWEQLVISEAVLGKNAHDARIVASMRVHGVTHILTFNDADFRRFAGITALNPAAVVAGTQTP